MAEDQDPDDGFVRQVRLISIVIAATMLLWMVAQWVGGKIGLEPHLVFLFDAIALASFLWALFVTWQIWRNSRGG